MYIGLRESQTRSILERHMSKLGLEEGSGLVLFGGGSGCKSSAAVAEWMTGCTENAALPHGSGTDRALGKHDFALIDTGGKFRGYVADVTRVSFPSARQPPCADGRARRQTFALEASKIPAEHMRIWTTVQAAQRKAHDAVRRGVTGREVDAAARKEVEGRATRREEAQGFTHRLGECDVVAQVCTA